MKSFNLATNKISFRKKNLYFHKSFEKFPQNLNGVFIDFFNVKEEKNFPKFLKSSQSLHLLKKKTGTLNVTTSR